MHKPVLLNETLQQFEYLKDRPDGVFVDGTLGAAGHSIAMASNFQSSIFNFQIIGIDKDEKALEIAKKNIGAAGLADNFAFVHDDFKNISKVLADLGIEKIDGALLDLGVSSMQLDNMDRGFSFTDPLAPLDMRMDQSQELSAKTILNFWSRERLIDLLRDGEEKFAKKIADNIGHFRKDKPIETVADLLQILEHSVPTKIRKTSKKHYATDTFRALRLTVNSELDDLNKAIDDYSAALASGGRLAVITFHSSEDRIVKQGMRRLENPCVCPPDLPTCTCGNKPSVKIITKKAIGPSEDEIRDNPRSRSSKLRVAEKL